MFNLKKKLINKLAALVLLSFISSHLSAEEDKNFKQVEATGRSVVIDGNIEVSRKRALEDALYLAALKGGADVNGFSAINSSTIINDQSVIRATNRVIDFKILNSLGLFLLIVDVSLEFMANPSNAALVPAG